MADRIYTLPGGGAKIEAHISDLADQAHGSVLMKQGETVVHVACVQKKGSRPDSGFVPLTVDYEERYYARGVLLGSQYVRRETHPSEEATLTSRMIDRAIRPFFPSWLRDEVQVVATALAVDEMHEPGVLALIGTSIALSISDIPWDGPLGAVRIGLRGEKIIVHPNTNEELHAEFVLAAREGKIVMLDGNGAESSPELLHSLLEKGIEECEKVESWIVSIREKEGRTKRTSEKPVFPASFPDLFKTGVAGALTAKLDERARSENRFAKHPFLEEAKQAWMAIVGKNAPETPRPIAELFFEEATREILRSRIEKGVRLDGRAPAEIRPITARAGGISERVHGSGTFYRGATHVATFLTIGSADEKLLVDGMEVSTEKHFIHHYNFPPFSAGETGRIGSPNRRAIGHGALAERALRNALPPREHLPYTLRLVSEVFASNGSTSMASVCAGTLALLDGGVPVKHTAGIAIGLVEETESTLLTDIEGAEDHFGDMDFKIAGTEDGITALQLDVKNKGITLPTAHAALLEGMRAVREIVGIMREALPKARTDQKQSAKESLAKREALKNSFHAPRH
ncbi:MAG: polyribonucleotide nucleotidyltransferase [Patescibacteria group bacterium]